jgi:hypothetical protein
MKRYYFKTQSNHDLTNQIIDWPDLMFKSRVELNYWFESI